MSTPATFSAGHGNSTPTKYMSREQGTNCVSSVNSDKWNSSLWTRTNQCRDAGMLQALNFRRFSGKTWNSLHDREQLRQGWSAVFRRCWRLQNRMMFHAGRKAVARADKHLHEWCRQVLDERINGLQVRPGCGNKPRYFLRSRELHTLSIWQLSARMWQTGFCLSGALSVQRLRRDRSSVDAGWNCRKRWSRVGQKNSRPPRSQTMAVSRRALSKSFPRRWFPREREDDL